MLKIVGFGSGAKDNMTLEASAAIAGADLIVGYTTYVDILKQYFPDKEYYSTNMMQEKERLKWNGTRGTMLNVHRQTLLMLCVSVQQKRKATCCLPMHCRTDGVGICWKATADMYVHVP